MRRPRDWEFELVVLAVGAFGYQQMYGGAEYTCLDVGGHFLWTMGGSLPTTLLINRKPVTEKPAQPEKAEPAAEGPTATLFGREPR